LVGSNELAFSLSTVNTLSTAVDFEGIGGLSSTSMAGMLNSALQLLTGWAQEKPPITATAVSAYETAVASMVPAEVSIANRTEQAADVAANPAVFGALTPAIVGLDTEYFGEHWPQNAAAGAAYGAALAGLVAALAIPPPPAPLGASPAAPAIAAGAVAQAAGTATMSGAMGSVGELSPTAAAPLQGTAGTTQLGSMLTQPVQAVMAAVQPLIGMFGVPAQGIQGLSSIPQSMMGPLGGLFNGMSASDAAVPGNEVVRAGGVAGTGAAPAGGAGGYPGAGLTSYTRPMGSFAPATGGRPVGLKTGLLSAELRAATASVGSGGASGLTPGALGPGMLGHGRPASQDEMKSHLTSARIAVADHPLNTPPANTLGNSQREK
jgi:PPE-repeat protein